MQKQVYKGLVRDVDVDSCKNKYTPQAHHALDIRYRMNDEIVQFFREFVDV